MADMDLDRGAQAAAGDLVAMLGLSGLKPPLGHLQGKVAMRVEGVEAPNAAMVSKALRDLDPAEFKQHLMRMFDVNLFAVCADAWSQVRRVREGMQRSMAEPEKEQAVDLPGHTLEAKLKPSLVVSLSGVDWCHVNFELTAKLKLSAASLKLLAGDLVGLRLADCEASLSLACEGSELESFKRTVNLAPEIQLPRAIALNPPPAR